MKCSGWCRYWIRTHNISSLFAFPYRKRQSLNKFNKHKNDQLHISNTLSLSSNFYFLLDISIYVLEHWIKFNVPKWIYYPPQIFGFTWSCIFSNHGRLLLVCDFSLVLLHNLVLILYPQYILYPFTILFLTITILLKKFIVLLQGYCR